MLTSFYFQFEIWKAGKNINIFVFTFAAVHRYAEEYCCLPRGKRKDEIKWEISHTNGRDW